MGLGRFIISVAALAAGILLLSRNDGGHGTIAQAALAAQAMVAMGPDPALTYRESNGRVTIGSAPPIIVTVRGDGRLDALRANSEGTYIDEIIVARDSAVSRWRARRKPLRIWIQPYADIPHFTAGHPQRIAEAIMQWDSVALPGLRFQVVPDSAAANVRVTWIDRFDEPISGRTRWGRDSGWWITSASIIIAVHHHQGATLDGPATRAIALHEMGHLIGLDHTADSNTVMAPRVRVRDLTDADRATARLLYSVRAGPLRQ
jgi:hypothetical protein